MAESQPQTVGRRQGIQGRNNSCYMDTTLFSMFKYTDTFDDILTHELPEDTDHSAKIIQHILVEICQDLRSDGYVQAATVANMREQMKIFDGSVDNVWVQDERDPEEFMKELFGKILKIEKFIHFSDISYYCYLMMPGPMNHKTLTYITYQNIFDECANLYDQTLVEVPQRLILVLPRQGDKILDSRFIMPSLFLDITDTLETSPRRCCICSMVAVLKCKKCFGIFGENRGSTFFCAICMDKCHQVLGQKSMGHEALNLPLMLTDYRKSFPPRTVLELHAVLSINAHHFVSFSKTEHGLRAPWVFFNSMEGLDSNNQFVPIVQPFDEFYQWNSELGRKKLLLSEGEPGDKMVRQMFCYPYVLIYHRPKTVYL